jgi:hypothetical protein
MASATVDSQRWQHAMRWKIALLMCAKLALLTLLWALFFSPSHRIAVDSDATSDRFGVADARAHRPSGGASIATHSQPEN